MGRLSRLVPAPARRLAQRFTHSTRRQAEQLLASGAFDAEYYAAVAGIEGATPLQAAEHYAASRAGTWLSPHPLIDLETIPLRVRDAMTGPDGIERLVRYLGLDYARAHRWSAFFDPRSESIAGEDPLAVLKNLRDDDTVPVTRGYTQDPPTLGQVRRAAIAFFHSHSDQFDAELPPRRDSWDDRETREWIRSVDARALDTAAVRASVVMPAYNRADTIGAAIDSVLAQSHESFELIVVDDGSTDATLDVVRGYAERDPRVLLARGPHTGVGAARNVGIERATGDVVAFLDSDNTWTPRYLELSIAGLLEDPSVVAVHSGSRQHGADGTIAYRGGDAQWSDLQLGNSIDINVLVARASELDAVGPFDTSIRRWVDYDLVLRLAARGPLAYLPFIGCDYDDAPSEGRITGRESLHWQWAVRERNLIDWGRVASAERVPGRTSVVTVIAQRAKSAGRMIAHLLDRGPDDVEILILDNGTAPAVGLAISLEFHADPRVTYLRLPVNNNFALAANYGAAHATGEHLVFVDSDADPRDGWIGSLLRRREETGAIAVQGLLTNPTGTVQHAGYGFFPEPAPLLAGLPVQDARRAPLDGLGAISASAMLIGAADFAALRGFDALYANGYEDIDLCLRAREMFPDRPGFACAPEAVVEHHPDTGEGRHRRDAENRRIFEDRWSAAALPDDRPRYEAFGLTVESLGADPIAAPFAVPVLSRTPRADALRWAIKTGVPNTRGGDFWGDLPFADGLARALEERGQQVVIDRYPARDRATAALDDVVLSLRGRHSLPPQPGAINILWVISRPGEVDPAELDGYDAVFAASEKWAAWMSERSGRRVDVLLQATDPDRFRPDLDPIEDPDDILFVGGARMGVENGREVVGMALDAGADIGLWGPSWRQIAPDHARGDYLDFEHTPRAYRSARIVLNDHWPDMAKWGFVNNRTFDAVACGTPMISDPVDGLALFEGAVATASSADEMRGLITDRSWQPAPDRLREIAELVRAEHSFGARADTLLATATDARRR